MWLRHIVTEKVQELLAGPFDAVLFAEVDELILPRSGSLAEYVEAFAASQKLAVRCVGFELHHDFTCEAPLDAHRPILAQRARWHRNSKYDKALLLTGVLTWSLGFHSCTEEVPVDDTLFLVHLHKYDFQAFLQRHEERCKYKHAASAIDNEWNLHYRTSGPALVAQYMNLPAPLERIPEWVREGLAGI